MTKISFIIPCYNSSKTILQVVLEIQKTMDTEKISDYEIILINDSSKDNTFEVLKKLVKTTPHTNVINFSKNFGQHAALMAGFNYAKGEIIVCLDDDGQTPASEAMKLIKKIEEGYDVCYAKYNHKQHSSFRNFGSNINKKMTEIMLGKPKDLYISSYFAMRRFVMEKIIEYKQCYPYVIGLVLRTTRNICNVDVNHKQREIGESGYTFTKLINLWMNGFTSFSVKPLRIATFFGFFSSIVGFIYLVFIIGRQLLFRSAPTGWSTIVALLLLECGIILIVLGLIGEYVGRIFMCLNSTPQYVIKDYISHEKES